MSVVPIFLHEDVGYIPKQICRLLHGQHGAVCFRLQNTPSFQISGRTLIYRLCPLLMITWCSGMGPVVHKLCWFLLRVIRRRYGFKLFFLVLNYHLHLLCKHFVGQLQTLATF